MAAKPLRTMLNRASAERCLRSLGATSAMVTPTARPHIVSVRGVLLHRCLRKDNPERPLFTGFYPSPGMVEVGSSAQAKQALGGVGCFRCFSLVGGTGQGEPRHRHRSSQLFSALWCHLPGQQCAEVCRALTAMVRT